MILDFKPSVTCSMNFHVRDETLKKELGYYEIESTGNLFQIVLAINSKEYFEQFKDF